MNHIIFNDDNIKQFSKLLKDKKVIILYKMNNCAHCNELKPKWDIVIKKLSNENINIYEIEYSFVSKLPSKYREILGYPTILSYDNGKSINEFKGKRTIKNIETFIKENTK